MKIYMYGHTGASNHGCEAIVRGSMNILNSSAELYSKRPLEDIKYGLDDCVSIREDRDVVLGRKGVKYLLGAIVHKLFDRTWLNTYFRRPEIFSLSNKKGVFLSIGGDNYTYQGIEELGDYNLLLNKIGHKTVLWGCSIDAHIVPKIVGDLSRFEMIVARESLTLKALENAGVKSQIRICPDPAFQLEPIETDLPLEFVEGNTIGINMSPLILKYGNSDVILENYKGLVDSILEHTEFSILFIPHVVTVGNSDIDVMRSTFKFLEGNSRVGFIQDMDCRRLKFIISKCRLFIGARTHSTIAAYSSCVPTLAVGYSMKARGIALDIFGSVDDYLVDVATFKTSSDLSRSFFNLARNEEKIRVHYRKIMPEYKSRALEAREFLLELE